MLVAGLTSIGAVPRTVAVAGGEARATAYTKERLRSDPPTPKGGYGDTGRHWAEGSLRRDVVAGAAWDAVVDEYFDGVYFKFNPSAGTTAGFHEYDARLEDYSRKAVEAQVAALRGMETRVAAFDPSGLNAIQTGDRELLLSTIRSQLLALETIRAWEKNPDSYSSGISESVFGIMSRKFAPPDARLASVIAREKQMPAVFEEARKNLKNPPRIYTEIALEQLPGIVSFFQSDVPSAFADATDPELKTEFGESNAAVIASLLSYEKWMKTDLLPRSNGDFRIGAETFSKKLLYDEMVDTPLDKLIEIGMENMRANQAEFIRIAKEVDRDEDSGAGAGGAESEHPAPDQLLQSFRDTFNGLIAFIQTKHIIDDSFEGAADPGGDAAVYARADVRFDGYAGALREGRDGSVFQRDAAGAALDRRTKSKNTWRLSTAGRLSARRYTRRIRGTMCSFCGCRQRRAKVRKLMGATSNAEGWAHYCEQMMLDEGYGQPGVGAKDERDSKMLRLGQLQDALLRNARFIVGIKMHTGKMTIEEGVEFFEKEGYQSHESGVIETKRGTADPTYLYYTLGKIQIMKLRADLQKKEGAGFSLEQFHDDFMRQGFPPIKIVRKALMGGRFADVVGWRCV